MGPRSPSTRPGRRRHPARALIGVQSVATAVNRYDIARDGTRTIRSRDPQPQPAERRDRGAGDRGLSLVDALVFSSPTSTATARPIGGWHARFVFAASGITADEAVLALTAAKGLASLKSRGVAAQTLRQVATSYGLSADAATSGEHLRAAFDRPPSRKWHHQHGERTDESGLPSRLLLHSPSARAIPPRADGLVVRRHLRSSFDEFDGSPGFTR
jgi:hypothetical protein